MPVLDSKFFNRDTIEVAKDLLGKFLVRKIGSQKVALVINETEAYDGYADKASHAYHGLTERNKIMFGQAGNFYVYLIYGTHFMLNVTTGPKDYPAAVLVRGGFTTTGEKNINGPGRVTKYLKIDKKFNGLSACPERLVLSFIEGGRGAKGKNNLWFEDSGIKVNCDNILASKRVGVDYAGDSALKLYNFKIVSLASLKK